MGDRQSRVEAVSVSNRSGTMRAMAALICVFALSACGNIEPWVKPYERQNLADPVMSFDLNPVSSAYLDHVYEAREGARGALGGAGGGCGCN
jgi:DNA primase